MVPFQRVRDSRCEMRRPDLCLRRGVVVAFGAVAPDLTDDASENNELMNGNSTDSQFDSSADDSNSDDARRASPDTSRPGTPGPDPGDPTSDTRPDDASVTHWFHQLQNAEGEGEHNEALRKIWDRYFEKLVNVANRALGTRSRRLEDEEDAASYVLQALSRGARSGRFRDVRDRKDLWKLLVCITRGQVNSQVRFSKRQRRGGGKVRGESVFMTAEEANGLDQLASDDPDAQFLVRMNERITQLLEVLRDDTFRQIALWKLEGFRNDEIAEKLGLSIRSVERKLSLIREDWSRVLEQ